MSETREKRNIPGSRHASQALVAAAITNVLLVLLLIVVVAVAVVVVDGGDGDKVRIISNSAFITERPTKC